MIYSSWDLLIFPITFPRNGFLLFNNTYDKTGHIEQAYFNVNIYLIWMSILFGCITRFAYFWYEHFSVVW